jgi:hypothetical protein
VLEPSFYFLCLYIQNIHLEDDSSFLLCHLFLDVLRGSEPPFLFLAIHEIRGERVLTPFLLRELGLKVT